MSTYAAPGTCPRRTRAGRAARPSGSARRAPSPRRGGTGARRPRSAGRSPGILTDGRTAPRGLHVMSYNATIAMPTEDRGRAHAFARALGSKPLASLPTRSSRAAARGAQRADDGDVHPHGGFGWVTAERRRPSAARWSACSASRSRRTPRSTTSWREQRAPAGRSHRPRSSRSGAAAGRSPTGRPPVAGPGAGDRRSVLGGAPERARGGPEQRPEVPGQVRWSWKPVTVATSAIGMSASSSERAWSRRRPTT